MKKRRPLNVCAKIASPGRKAAYTAAAAAAVAGAPEVEAVLVPVPLPSNPSIQQGFSQPIDFNSDGNTDLILNNWNDYANGGTYQSVFVNVFPGRVASFFANGRNYARALEMGDVIDSSMTSSGNFSAFLGRSPSGNLAEFNSAEDAYLGVQFPISGQTHYGWVRLSIDNSANEFILKELVYNNAPGQGLTISAIPEAGTLGFFAAGAVGLTAMRRRRSQNEESAA